MALDVHIHPDLSQFPKFAFKPSNKEKVAKETSEKNNFSGQKIDKEEEKQAKEENNEAIQTAIKIGVVVVVFAVAIPVAKWFFKQSAGMVREARGLGKALSGK